MPTAIATSDSATKGTVPKDKKNVVLPPDMAILIETRIKAGEKSLQIRAISNLLLHDPVLSLEILQYSNSVMFGGSHVKDLEAAVARMGVAKLVTLLSEINSQAVISHDIEVMDAFEILRYNCRRISIVSMIVAAVARPAITGLARLAGLLGDIGHMVALHRFGKQYCDLAKANKRKNIPFRLEKDLKFNIEKEMVRFLKAKGVPKTLLAPYDLEDDAKTSPDLDVRLCVQSAMELIDAYDGGRFANYHPKVGLPSSSTIRLLRLSNPQLEKLHKTVEDYLRTVAAEEAPDGVSLLISSMEDEESAAEFQSSPDEVIRIPTYPNLSVNTKSREALQNFFNLCEKERSIEALTQLTTGYLRDSGLFERAALIRVNPEGTLARVERSSGLDQAVGTEIKVTDDLSPFRVLRLEIKSANAKANQLSSPFGASAYAIGPLDVLPSGERLVLYVDRSNTKGLTMESRRVFRLVLGLLMRSIQALREPAVQ